MNTRTILMTTVALVACGLAPGCGGDGEEDGDGETTVAEALTKEEYITRGDEICAQGTLQIATQGQERFSGGQQPSPEQIEQFATEVVVPTLQGQVDQLSALPAAAGDRRAVDAIYDALQRGVDALEADPGLLAEPAAGGAFDKANRLARGYGFRQCGES